MAHPHHTPSLALLEEALTVLFCRIDDAYYQINPRGARYASLKELSDSEILTLALLQQLRGIESEHSFLREASRFFSHLLAGDRRLLAILVPSSRAQAQALLGALAARDLGRTGGRARDDGDRLDPPFGPPSAPGQPVGGRFRGGGVGEVGIVRRLRGQAAPHLPDQPGAHLLLSDALEDVVGTYP